MNVTGLDARVRELLQQELSRIERLLTEAGMSQLERLLDAEGRSTVLTEEQRGMVQRAAKKTADRQTLQVILALAVKSDDEIRSRLIDKLGAICRRILEETR